MKALVVDDDIISRMALVDLLSAYGVFDLVEAEDGEAAWNLLQDGLRPVVCFCDVRMPRMTGIGLLQKMKSVSDLAAIPFVLVSSASDRDTVLQAVRLGAVGYILKPLHAAEARVHLEKIFRLTLDKLAEDPAATMARLHIGIDRLLAYLRAFGEQVAVARVELPAMIEQGALADLRLRLDALHTGCATLGLWQMAGELESLREAVADAVRIDLALAGVADTVARQSNRSRAAQSLQAAAPKA
jgi:two-component system chemotaxis response regulator CheY